MHNSFDLTYIQRRNKRHMLNTKILGFLSLIFVYGFSAALIGIVGTFFSPLLGALLFFGLLIYWTTNRIIKNNHQYEDSVDDFLQIYQAQRLLPTQHYKQLFNILDEICIAYNTQRPDVYLIDLSKVAIDDPTTPPYDDPKDQVAYDIKPYADKLIQNNIFGLQLKDRTVLVINQDLLGNLSRYELESIIAIELGYTKNLFNTFLLMHHIEYQTINKFINIIIAIAIAGMYGIGHMKHAGSGLVKVFIFLAIVFAIFYVIKKISYTIFRHNNLKMVRSLNDNAISITENPEILISALKKINQNNYDPTGDSDFNNLWLNPVKNDTYDNQTAGTLTQLYNTITSISSTSMNVVFNNQLRISIDEQLALIQKEYPDHQANTGANDVHYQGTSNNNNPDPNNPLQLQNQYANDFDTSNINVNVTR